MTLPAGKIIMHVIIAINYFDFDFWSRTSIVVCHEKHLLILFPEQQIAWFNDIVFKVTEICVVQWAL